ncbi:MAG TPA: ABC transporter substrate-binding protein [Candidatus Saccharimonadales bacterium]|nr:ABC transporter substrate-binding protein [Candidatus Saccharimonadales bacterium]
MKIAKGVLVAALALLPTNAMAEDIIQIGLFNRDAAIIAAVGKGFLKQENIRTEINTVTDSPTLLRNLITGKYDLILNNADNVIAWAEGQGEDPQKNDFVIFLGGSQGVDQKLVVAPGINGYADLKGKILAADAVTTGYAVVAMAILKKHGLEWKRDYEVKSFGNTTARADAMNRGDASGAMMSMPEEEIQKRGFKVLAKSEDYVKNYARGLGATRREWASANEDLVVRFNRAMIRATDWLQDAKNKDEAIQLMLGETKNNRGRAEAMFAQALSPTMGLTPRSRIDMEGIRTVIELREIAGLMKAPVPKPEKYVDERFYKKALETLGK